MGDEIASVLQPNLVVRLRELADEGAEVSELLDEIGVGRNAQSEQRLLAIAYFREAFSLPVNEAMVIGASNRFTDGSWTDDEVSSRLRPAIERTRKSWGR